MKYDEYERDEIIRGGSKKAKPRVPKSKHKHEYVDKPLTEEEFGYRWLYAVEVCTICGKKGKTKYGRIIR